MATDVNDIPVAAVEHARRRDEVLPEHEARWPADERARTLIQARYDGTAGTSHEIGLALVTVKHGCYPSWRVEQIAQQLGLAESKRDEVILRSRQRGKAEGADLARTQGASVTKRVFGSRPTAAGEPEIQTLDQAIEKVGQGEPTPTRMMLLEDLQVIKSNPKCEKCGEIFEPWKYGRGFMTRKCRACYSEKMGGQLLQHRTEKVKPDAEAPKVEPQTTQTETVMAEAAPEPRREVFLAPVDIRPFRERPEARMVSQLIDMLPRTGMWTARRREVWLKALAATLDLVIEVEDEQEVTR